MLKGCTVASFLPFKNFMQHRQYCFTIKKHLFSFSDKSAQDGKHECVAFESLSFNNIKAQQMSCEENLRFLCMGGGKYFVLGENAVLKYIRSRD